MNRYILTGAPGAGKTAVVLELETRGYPIVREAAEDVIRLEQAKGVEKPWETPGFQDRVLALQILRNDYAPEETAFIDRGYLDGLAYTAKDDTTSRSILEVAQEEQIDHIFFIDLLTHTDQNTIRRENRTGALTLDESLLNIYQNRAPIT